MARASNHPLVLHLLTRLRDRETPPAEFRGLVRALSLLIGCEATADLATAPRPVVTPMGPADGHALADAIGLVPILRAGLGMVEGLLELIPDAQVWHLGMYRDEHTLLPRAYYNKLPTPLPVETALVLDPMLATGGSADQACAALKRSGVTRIRLLALIAAPEGIAKLAATHPDVSVYVGAIDQGLNEVGFIVPGLGDAGDRQYGTS